MASAYVPVAETVNVCGLTKPESEPAVIVPEAVVPLYTFEAIVGVPMVKGLAAIENAVAVELADFQKPSVLAATVTVTVYVPAFVGAVALAV